MAERQDFARYRANLQDEIDSAALYRTLADIEAQPQLAQLFEQSGVARRRTEVQPEEHGRALHLVPDERVDERPVARTCDVMLPERHVRHARRQDTAAVLLRDHEDASG